MSILKLRLLGIFTIPSLTLARFNQFSGMGHWILWRQAIGSVKYYIS